MNNPILILGDTVPDTENTDLTAASEGSIYIDISKPLRVEVPVGIPQPWPLETPPDGWLMMNGQNFDKTAYPELALAYPSGSLPDMRGNFIRGWSNGSGVDAGRNLLSWQQDQIQEIWGNFWGVVCGVASNSWYGLPGGNGAFKVNQTYPIADITTTNDTKYEGTGNFNFNAASVARTGSETHPSNWSFNYIVRAA